ncbi:B3 domain-containing protein Os01g0723500-like [Cornus florida]|uniref:B3 domain-containing protein Os01g0723500-like n=1 Tax=Cornus florida TaxID=4283 RepID=UPI00289C8154|nr:B3 domain-containing protein Os01g0723500-like [Cornus florida]
MYLQDGWKEFLRDNSLGDNEFLVFRYDGNLCFNVKIFDKSGCKRADVPVAGKRRRGRPRKPLQLRPSKHSEIDQHLPDCKSENAEEMKGKGIGVKIETGETELPVEAKEANSGSKRRFGRKGSLNEESIPKSFSKKHLPQSKSKIVLQNPEGRAWLVNMVPRASGHSYSFSEGWRAFVSDNLLKSGDGCIFGLVDRQEMKVHFFRSE